MLDHVATTGQAGNWAAGERILVAFSGEPSSEQLVRSAKRLADAFHASWTVVTVEMPGTAQARDGKVQLSSPLNLAFSLGASIVTVPATSVPAGLSGYAREVRATAIVLGQSPHSWLLRAVCETLLDQLSRALPGVALHVLPDADPVRRSRPTPGAINWTGVAIGLALVALTTLANLFIADSRLRRAATVGSRTATENAAIAAFGQQLASVSTEALGRAVIVLTARDRTDEMVAALDLSADDYVTKPFDTAELLARVRVARRHLPAAS